MFKIKHFISIVLLCSAGMGQAADIVIGVPNWPSAAITSEILKNIIQDNFGLEVELQNGSNPVIFQA